MKTISEIIGGAQTLLPLDYELQDCFPEPLSCSPPLLSPSSSGYRRAFATGGFYPWAKDGPVPMEEIGNTSAHF